jgi:hypothetical protein
MQKTVKNIIIIIVSLKQMRELIKKYNDNILKMKKNKLCTEEKKL